MAQVPLHWLIVLAPAFYDTGRRPLHNGDRFVKLVSMTGETGTGLKATVATTDTLCTKICIEQILKMGLRREFKSPR